MKIGSFAAAAAVITLIFSLLAFAQGRADVRRQSDEDALRIAAALAHAYSEESDEPTGGTQKLAEALKVRSALILKNTKIVVSSVPDQQGRSLAQDSLSDKALYDAAQSMKARAKKNADEREKDPTLTRNPFPEHDIDDAPDSLRAAVPVKRDDRVIGLAQVEVTPARRPVTFPAVIFAIALGALVLFAPVSGRRLPQPLFIGMALLVVMTAIQSRMLVSWRDDLRHTRAEWTAESMGTLEAAGVPAEFLVRSVGMDRPAELVMATDMFEHPLTRAAIKDFRAPGAKDPVAGASMKLVGGREVWFDDAHFAEGRAHDTRDLFRWSVVAAILAGLTFVLGTLGRFGAFWRAFLGNRTAYGYLAPAMVGMAVLVFVPVVFGIVLGFTDRRYNVFEFAGLANYVAILSDFDIGSTKNFYFKLGVTFLWTTVNIVLHVGIGLFLALLLNDEMLRAKGIYRVLLVIPWAIPNYITALIWKGMFHKQFGAVNFALDALGLEPVAWFGSFWPAFVTNVATNTWLGFPFMMVVSLGALSSIPSDLYEAAFVDGASRWQRFRNITLPLLMPALVPAVIMGTVWTFNMFNIIYLVSGGAPDGATDILITDAFRWAFERDKYGYAAAYSTIIFVILLLFTLLTNKVTGATKGAFE